MLTKIFQWLGIGPASSGIKRGSLERVVVHRSEHSVSRKDISRYALKVLYRLHEKGYEALLVGGGVRDLLLNQHPKDFDIVTNAHPEEVLKLFRNSRMIGRRFKLVHVFFGGDIVEVATFRTSQTKKSANLLHSEEGMILRDNIFGTLEEDVWRRDFTINALYYNISDFTLIDYVGGLKDLKEKRIRVIGDPDQRFKEDPVRMLRAVRFAGKLGFQIDKESEKSIIELGCLVNNVPAARLFEEFLKLFLTGSAYKNFILLRQYRLFSLLFPGTEETLGNNHNNENNENNENEENLKNPQNFAENLEENFIVFALQNTDTRILEGKPVAAPFLLATFLWSALQKNAKQFQQAGMGEYPALFEAMDEVLRTQQKNVAIPKRLSGIMREIWSLQLRLSNARGHRAKQLFLLPRFKAAYDFLLLRFESGEKDLEPLVNFWTKYIRSDENTRLELAADFKGGNKKKPKRRPIKSKRRYLKISTTDNDSDKI